MNLYTIKEQRIKGGFILFYIFLVEFAFSFFVSFFRFVCTSQPASWSPIIGEHSLASIFRSIETIGELLIVGRCITMIVIRVHYRIHRTLIVRIIRISGCHLLVFGKCTRTLFHDVDGRCARTLISNCIGIAASIVSSVGIAGHNHLERKVRH